MGTQKGGKELVFSGRKMNLGLGLALIWGIVSLTPALAAVQQSRVHRVAVFLVGSPDYPTLKGLLDGLSEAGYIEGRNLILEMAIKKSYEELRPMAQGLRGKRPDVIVAFGETTTALVKEAMPGVPIVFVHAIDPVGSGFIKSLAHPQTNLTGLMSYPGFELQVKRLDLFKQLVPKLRRVAALYNALGGLHHTKSLEVLRQAAPALGLALVEKPVKSAAEAERAVAALSRTTTDGVFVVCSFLFNAPFPRMATLARERRLPLMGCTTAQVAEQGALWTYAPDIYRMGHQGAWYVDQILKGAKPQDLPVETPTKLDLAINRKTAQEIGLALPPELLILADKVFH